MFAGPQPKQIVDSALPKLENIHPSRLLWCASYVIDANTIITKCMYPCHYVLSPRYQQADFAPLHCWGGKAIRKEGFELMHKDEKSRW